MDVPMVIFRREYPGNDDWRGVMQRSNMSSFRSLENAAWFRPDEIIGAVLRQLTGGKENKVASEVGAGV